MHAYVIFAHPTRNSFSGEVLEELCRGLCDGGHSYEIGDLYGMNFRSEVTLDEYNREMNVSGNRPTLPVPSDVKVEHRKIAKADGLAFVFPVWWSDCPAKLKGWFDRVWVCGYAYEYKFAKEAYSFSRLSIERALVLCPAGNDMEILRETGIAESMERLYTNDRLRPDAGVKHCEFVVLPGMVDPGARPRNRARNLEITYQLGRDFFVTSNLVPGTSVE